LAAQQPRASLELTIHPALSANFFLQKRSQLFTFFCALIDAVFNPFNVSAFTALPSPARFVRLINIFLGWNLTENVKFS